LDFGPKANRAHRANMLVMNRSAANASVSSPRRFILLPEEPVDAPRNGPRIRRYQLTSMGHGAGRRRAGNSNVDNSTARIAREATAPTGVVRRLGRM
jgi:hypothetical protein